ncbi:MAG: hypothetical protein KAH21_02240 [Spirochaetaceae bacterium]|nr:hypothetical protein [Spirochaetaceae bacterium]
MRTTLTLDTDIARQLKEKSHKDHKSFKETVNQILKLGLYSANKAAAESKAFEVHSSPGGFQPGIDPVKLNRLMAEMDEEGYLDKT